MVSDAAVALSVRKDGSIGISMLKCCSGVFILAPDTDGGGGVETFYREPTARERIRQRPHPGQGRRSKRTKANKYRSSCGGGVVRLGDDGVKALSSSSSSSLRFHLARMYCFFGGRFVWGR